MNFKIIILLFLFFCTGSNDFRINQLFDIKKNEKEEFIYIFKNRASKLLNNSINLYSTSNSSNQEHDTHSTEIETIKENIQKKTRFFLLLTILVFSLFIGYIISNKRKKKNIEIKSDNNALVENILCNELDIFSSILDTQEKERNKITDELFDKLGSEMATIRHFIDAIKSKDTSLKDKDEFLKKLQSLTDLTYKDVQKIEELKNICIPINERLIPALKSLASLISNTDGLQINVNHSEIMIKIKFRIELEIFRLIQILLLILVRNTEATFVNLKFSLDGRFLIVAFEDNSSNDLIDKSARDIEFSRIKKRLVNIGGSISFKSRTKKDNTTILNIPI